MENNNMESGVKGDNKLLVPSSIIVAGLIIAGAVIYVSGPKTAPLPNGGVVEQQPKGDVVQVLKIKSSDYVLGNPAAKVVVVEYADFQCPFCGKFHTEVGTKIVENYVKTGKVAFVYRDFAFLGEESIRSAEAARCAGEQNKFWDFHDYLFTNQKGENQASFSDVNLKGYAKILKLDTTAFDKCFDSGKYKDAIEAANVEGRSIGVNGTPATFVNGVLVSGAQPFSVFQAKIDAELKK